MNKKKVFAIALLSFQISFAQNTDQKPLTKEKNIEGVTITKTKKAVEQKADRTIFDFSEQPVLNSGSSLEGIKKLPGMVVTDIAGMMYQGKLLEVYMDGRPLNINSNELTAFLEGMPASAIERIEVITQPGAEFPATSGGAILNIITSKKSKSYLTATYSGGYRFSNYDKFRNKFNNSIVLNSKNKFFGWQLSAGQNYNESFNENKMDGLSTAFSDKYARSYFVKAATTFDIGPDRLLLNYDYNNSNSDAYSNSDGTFLIENPAGSNVFLPEKYTNLSKSKTKTDRNEFTATYQKKFDDKNKKLDLKFNFSNLNSQFNQNGVTELINYPGNPNYLDMKNSSNQKYYNFKVDYSQPINILDEGKISFGGLYEKTDFTTDYLDIKNLDYQRQTASTYAELNAKLKKFSFITGVRAENYDISGKSLNLNNQSWSDLKAFKRFELFPNASIQYDIAPSLYFNVNYNRKISLPSTSQLNPNNNTFQNPNVNIGGNPNIQPTIYNNFQAKLSAFDYAFISYDYSIVNDQVMMHVERDAYTMKQTNVNIDKLTQHSFNVGLPLPLMIFTKPLSEIMKFNFNPDKINFLYFYSGYQFQDIKEVLDKKGLWFFNISGQFILPYDIKVSPTFSYSTKGNYYFFRAEKPFMNSVDLNISKKFDNDRLSISLFANDIFNSSRMSVKTMNTNTPIYLNDRRDSRNFGISINYKIPTKNKLAKVEQNILNTENIKEESGSILNQNK
ncbi:TonB-dependent receptor domain-containing protein [Amniculibacterium sp. G2-70]|uniref:TonB-dependent receptor domain-containing protein n=1 Tax=Amniculibacterium sp. G2-70 TaxID=2767188 RepID=UPI00165424AC|nr:TonB-dependent receptor [Amniculibacterium sp. G2-70]